MEIAAILAFIDNGQMALPQFQRGYVWNREQMRGLFESLYRRHPVGGLLVWHADSASTAHRGDSQLAPGTVRLLLDGQQRMTTLYGIVRGKPPTFFEGQRDLFSGLMFHVEREEFEFYQPVKMQNDPLWINVTNLIQNGIADDFNTLHSLDLQPEDMSKYINRLNALHNITKIDLHIEDVVGSDKSLDVVVGIFNRVNSGGTKLSKGDLALANICAEWPDARNEMKQALCEWAKKDYYFNLDWLLRSVNVVLTGEAQFRYLRGKGAAEIQDALKRAKDGINAVLNMIDGNLGLDHDRVFFGRFAVPVMAYYLDRHSGPLSAEERDKLLFWYVQAGMWGRFSSGTESTIDQDLEAVKGSDSSLDSLLEQLRLSRNGLQVEPGHFTGWSLGARFYPILYMLTRMGEAKDWGTGDPLKKGLLGKMSQLEVHHIFPKSRLYDAGHYRADVNALANFCFLTKETNLSISNRLPEDYFPEVETKHPGALASQWVPTDPELWKLENYSRFLEARRELLAAETNRRLESLLHGDTRWFESRSAPEPEAEPALAPPGGIASEDEEAVCEELNGWVEAQGLPRGEVAFDYTDTDSGEQLAVFDLAWPEGVQTELSQPVAVLLNEGAEVLAIAAKAGYRCFTDAQDFRTYVEREINPTPSE